MPDCGTYLNEARNLHRLIQKALIEEWDPIGVKDVPEAQDEYNAYVSTLYRMLIMNKTKNEIFDYLWWLETEHMGLLGDRQRTEKFALYLLNLLHF